MTTATKVTIECDRCNGSGYLPHFAGIANGTCFLCCGSGKRQVRKASIKPLKPLTEYQISLIDEITNGNLEELGYSELLNLRNAAYCNWDSRYGLNLLETWRERGEMHFQARQSERLEEYRASRC